MANIAKIPCLLLRGGTSRAPFFRKQDLPANREVWDKILLAIMGSPDVMQIDGLGGGKSVTSKVAILSQSEHSWAEIDFLFAQVGITQAKVDWDPSCGNILSGVAPAAIEMGLVQPNHEQTKVKIRAVNTGTLVEATVQTPGGQVMYAGDTAIDGVPGTAAPILLNFMNVVGSKTGKLLPTGHLREKIAGVTVTCIDIAVPMVIARAADLGKSGYETKQELDGDQDFLARIEEIRRLAGKRMGMGNVANSVTPKFAILAPPRHGGGITSRYFVPHTCHPTHAVTGAICVSYCSVLKGSVAEGLAVVSHASPQIINIEHPAGKIAVELVTKQESSGMVFASAGVIRTARLLMSGEVYLPQGIIE